MIIIMADKLNTCLHAATKTTPYQPVFGQLPHSSPCSGTTTSSVREEAVSDIFGTVHVTCISIIMYIKIMHAFFCL